MIEKGVAAIPICTCGKTRKYRDWAYRDLKSLVREIKDNGHSGVEFLSEICPDCVLPYLPVIAANAPMAVFKQAHQLPL